ncbi:MAG: sugar phosphate nucleotidyltransferase [Candidatus Zixiibacteriota bacterium]
METVEAVVLAGGKGTRLLPYTAELPKPLAPVGDRPIIEYLLLRMKKCGVRKVHLAVNHLAHLIMATLGDGGHLGLTLSYSHEKTPLSTIGPLTLINDLPEQFVVANGDVLSDIDFQVLFDHHASSGALVTVATQRRTTRIDYGVLEVNDADRIVGFQEKPAYSLAVSMGIYVFSRQVLKFVPSRQRFGFDDLMRTLLKQGQRINAYQYDGFWLDIGQPEDYERASREIDRIRQFI